MYKCKMSRSSWNCIFVLIVTEENPVRSKQIQVAGVIARSYDGCTNNRYAGCQPYRISTQIFSGGHLGYTLVMLCYEFHVCHCFIANVPVVMWGCWIISLVQDERDFQSSWHPRVLSVVRSCSCSSKHFISDGMSTF